MPAINRFARLLLLLGLASLHAGCASAANEPDRFDGKQLLFGNLHAHSSLSGDAAASHPDEDLSPATAFAYADEHGLDFLALTDHHKAVDSAHRLALTAAEYQQQLFEVAMAYNATHDFIAIPALEWGNTATGNHVNVFGPTELPPDSIKDAEYDKLYAWAASKAEFVQMNHPYSWKGKSNRNRDVGNFGEALYADQDAFVAATDEVIEVISIITTVWGGHISGPHRFSEAKTHREPKSDSIRAWQEYLNMGFHISPAASQDTHWRNWGTVTAARTAAWADARSYAALMDAIRANRVYATEDDELAVVFQVAHQGQVHWMGETVLLDEETADVELRVRISQLPGSDGDPVDEGPYTVAIYSDWDGIGGRRAALWDRFENLEADQLHSIIVPVAAGEYFYIVVTEQGGKDNPVGDGEDDFDNDSGATGADGRRDDMNDSAWTTPIWFQLRD